MSSESKTVNVQVQNDKVIEKLAHNFDPIITETDPLSVTSSVTDYFSRIQITENITTNRGPYAVIDVQPDFRYIYNYIQYNVSRIYPSLDTKAYSYVTPMTIIGYSMSLVYSQILYNDLTHRTTLSRAAANFKSDTYCNGVFDQLLKCRVPSFLEPIIKQLVATRDPRRNNILYCPSLAGYSDPHDYGRTLPPQIFYVTHDYLSRISPNTPYQSVIDGILNIEIMNFNAEPARRINNYLGTGTEFGQHHNWINRSFFKCASPMVNRVIMQRPSLSPIPLVRSALNNDSQNIYRMLLLSGSRNRIFITPVYDQLSNFFQNAEPSTKSLEDTNIQAASSLIMQHMIQVYQLPTWTGLSHKSLETQTIEDDAEFATHNSFLTEYKRSLTRKDPIPATSDGETSLREKYCVRKGSYNPQKSQYLQVFQYSQEYIEYETLYFSPYNLNLNSLSQTISLGILIENSDIYAVGIPLEHPWEPVSYNNRYYAQSAIPIANITQVSATTNPATDPGYALAAVRTHPNVQPLMLITSTMSTVYHPSIPEEGIEVPGEPSSFGRTEIDNVISLALGYNVKAGTSQSIELGRKHLVWSSYRLVGQPLIGANPNISMMISLRPIYGTNVTLSGSQNPVSMIPA